MKLIAFVALIILFFFTIVGIHNVAASDLSDTKIMKNGSKNTSDFLSSKQIANLYFINPNNNFLTAEEKIMPQAENPVARAKLIIDALIQGPRGQLVRSLPKNTGLRSLFIDEQKTAFIDLNTNGIRFPGGSLTEHLSIYSIVNSIVLNISGIESVKILLNGKEDITMAGHIDISSPFEANMLIIR
jgi:hypothetical protein